MNILSISSILPIPDRISHNDFVFQIYINYRKLHADDRVLIIKPIKYDLNLLSILRGNTRLGKLKRQYSWEIHDFQVEIFPYFSAWGMRNLHSFLTRSIYFLNRKRIRELFSRYNFDVIHAQYIFSDGMLAYQLKKKYKIPYFVTTHHERYYFDHFFSRKAALRILNSAAQVTPLSHTNASQMHSLGIRHIKMAPLGFDPKFLRVQKSQEKGKISLFTASVLIPLKNIDKVIEAMARLVKVHDISFTIIGKGPEKESLVSLTRDLKLENHVLFVDHIPHEQIADEMHQHDIFVMPSYFETFGRVYFECMAMGIPIICARNSGIHGFFEERKEGLSVDHRHIDEIEKAIAFLAENPKERKSIGLAGQKLVENYTWEKVANDLHERYNNAISEIH